ncbi:AEC family transporter [Cyclobacterium plantarum]|uniref:AEC family transporter n=1 Tax=Cyclobacterium plantarum TaxID=2716263 RepID=UPI003F6F71EB
MEITIELYKSLFPFLLCLLIGYLGIKKLDINKNWLTYPLVYFFMPFLVIYHILSADAEILVFLSVISFTLASLMVIPAILTYRKLGKNEYLIKSSFSFFNVAFFGIPTFAAIYGPESISSLICIYVGTALFGDLIGFYQVARPKFGRAEAFFKVLKTPFIYAFALAIGLKVFGASNPDYLDFPADVTGNLVSAAGMLIIGFNLKEVSIKSFEWKTISWILGIRMISAIVIIAVLLGLEYFCFDVLESKDRQMLGMVSLFPIAANVTVFASLFQHNERASALLILFSMVLSLIAIPIFAALLIA